MNYIVIHWNYGRESMQAVVQKMEQPCEILAKKNNGAWFVYCNTGNGWYWLPTQRIHEYLSGNNNIINWGNRILRNSDCKVNFPSAIENASDKRLSRILLQSAGVKVPTTVTWQNPEKLQPKFPLIIRPSHHHAGKKFYIAHTPREAANLVLRFPELADGYFSEIFPKTHEYRVHCAHGKILMISEKPLQEGEIRANHSVIEESWRALRWSEYNEKICKESLKAVEVLGLDYGAVDIMYNSKDDSVAVCEINTSPSVSTEYTSGKYAAYFDWLIRNNFPEHLESENKFVFYNEILRS